MPHVTFPIDPNDGLILDVMIGLTGQETAALVASGQPIPRPVVLRGAIDSGSDVTCIASSALSRYGLKLSSRASSNTVAGPLAVNLYEISLSLPCAGRLPAPLLVLDYLEIMELVQTTPGIDALVGRDVLRHLLMILDGQRNEFTLSD